MRSQQRRVWLYVFTGLVAFLNVVALLSDPSRWGQRGSANDQPFLALLGLAVLMAGLVGGSWACSDFKYRTPVAVLQLVLDFGALAIIAAGMRPRITVWDTVEDVVWLVTAGLQAFGGPGPRRQFRGQ